MRRVGHSKHAWVGVRTPGSVVTLGLALLVACGGQTGKSREREAAGGNPGVLPETGTGGSTNLGGADTAGTGTGGSGVGGDGLGGAMVGAGGLAGGNLGGGVSDAGGSAGASSLCQLTHPRCGYGPMIQLILCQDCNAAGVVWEHCSGTGYSYGEIACAPHRCAEAPVPGADVDCAPGQVCVVHYGADGAAALMDCLDYPCESPQLTESCALEAICPETETWSTSIGTDTGGLTVECHAAPPSCPESPPTINDPCPRDGMRCIYQYCDEEQIIDATCTEGTWSADTVAGPCQEFSCAASAISPTTCAAGEICSYTYQGPSRENVYCSSEEPGLVVEVPTGNMCNGYPGSISIGSGTITVSCTCTDESGSCM